MLITDYCAIPSHVHFFKNQNTYNKNNNKHTTSSWFVVAIGTIDNVVTDLVNGQECGRVGAHKPRWCLGTCSHWKIDITCLNYYEHKSRNGTDIHIYILINIFTRIDCMCSGLGAGLCCYQKRSMSRIFFYNSYQSVSNPYCLTYLTNFLWQFDALDLRIVEAKLLKVIDFNLTFTLLFVHV